MVEGVDVTKGRFDHRKQGLPVRGVKALRVSNVEVAKDVSSRPVDRSDDEPLGRLADLHPGEELNGAPAQQPAAMLAPRSQA